MQNNFQDTKSFNKDASGTIHLCQYFLNIHEGKVSWRGLILKDCPILLQLKYYPELKSTEILFTQRKGKNKGYNF